MGLFNSKAPPLHYTIICYYAEPGVFRLQGFVLELVKSQPNAFFLFICVFGLNVRNGFQEPKQHIDSLTVAQFDFTPFYIVSHCLQPISLSSHQIFLILQHFVMICRSMSHTAVGGSDFGCRVKVSISSEGTNNLAFHLGRSKEKVRWGFDSSLFLFQQAWVFVKYNLCF